MNDKVSRKKKNCKEIFNRNFSPDEEVTTSVEDYIKNRLVFKIELYYCLAKKYEWRYKLILCSGLVLGALIPLLINLDLFEQHGSLKDYIITIISVLIIVLVAVETTYKYREQFRDYKRTEDHLRTELNLFQTKAGPYKDNELDLKTKNSSENIDQTNSNQRFRLLVERVEGIIGAERLETILRLTAENIKNNN